MKTASQTAIETLAVLIVGAILGLAVNALNSQGLPLARNHFARQHPTDVRPAAAPPPTAAPIAQLPPADADPVTNPGGNAATDNSMPGSPPPDAAPPPNPGEAEVDDEGYQVLALQAVVDLQRSDEFAAGQAVIIDARDEKAYAAGHIPGAYQLDHYRLERRLPAVLPACETAERIVLYCHGGDCEDSKLAASDLMNAGIGWSKVFIFTGGFTAWQEAGLAVEKGERGSAAGIEADQ